MKFLNVAGGVFEGDLEKTLKDSDPDFLTLTLPGTDPLFSEYGLDKRSKKPYFLIVYGLRIEEPSSYSVIASIASDSDTRNQEVIEALKRTLNIPMKEVGDDPSLAASNRAMANEYSCIKASGMTLREFLDEKAKPKCKTDYRNN